jgi:hypothetical protein
VAFLFFVRRVIEWATRGIDDMNARELLERAKKHEKFMR